jgi:succinate-semialdehyde dehydrogenase/glutarate-semialdehyde dehydrogenase
MILQKPPAGRRHMSLISTNPATGKTLERYDEYDRAELDTRLLQLERARRAWADRSFAERAAALRRVAQRLRARQDDLARTMGLEMGKPVRQGRAEIEKCAWTCEFYADHGERFMQPEVVASDASRSAVVFQPLGVLLAVMPWNFPFWQVFRCVAPALMAGNGVALKHASNVSGCAAAIEELFVEEGAQAAPFRWLPLSAGRVDALIEHPIIRAVTLTGSTPAGRAVAAKAGACLKKTVMELGGSDPYLIFEDADLARAAEACVASRMINGGQSCIAAKRFIVVAAVAAAFEEAIRARLAAYVPSDPLAQEALLGPLARTDLRDDLHRLVEASVGAGASLKLGGQVPAGPGAFYPPTLLTGVRPGMPAFDQETFGPVAALCTVRDEAEAVAWANASPFGLGAAVFTSNPARGERVALRLDAGACFVNAFVRSDPRLPFGGVKESGYGRELSHWGMREFVNVKTLYVA